MKFIAMHSLLTWISDNQQMIYIVILMIFLGIEVIGRVPAVLHTPSLSARSMPTISWGLGWVSLPSCSVR